MRLDRRCLSAAMGGPLAAGGKTVWGLGVGLGVTPTHKHKHKHIHTHLPPPTHASRNSCSA